MREWLGGLEACGVFAPVFVLLSCLLSLLLSFWLSFSLFAPVVFCLSSFLVFPALALYFLFPLRYMRKKKGRNSLRPLLFCCGALWVYYMLSASLSVASFDFEKIQPAPQVRCALNLPPRVLRVFLIARVSPTIAIAFSE